MLIDLKDLCANYKFIPKGIIHVGAHNAEESGSYKELNVENVIWIEGNPDIFNSLYENFKEKGNKIFNYLVSDSDDTEYEFKVTNNGESSSILELGTHKEKHPHIFVTDKKILNSKTLDSIILENSINIEEYDFLNLDIQGAELLALKGFTKNIDSIKYIYTEVNVDFLYENCALISEIDNFLYSYGFHRKETKILEEYGWGDAFYIRKND
jgi:FkbM family methyltransferase